ALGISAIVLYFPYFVSFASQAGGLIPNLVYATRGAHLWVMFATFWIPIFAYLIYRWRKSGHMHMLIRGLAVSIAVVLVLWSFSLLLPTLLPLIGNILTPIASTLANTSITPISNMGLRLQESANNLSLAADSLLSLLGAPSMSELFSEAFTRRWQHAGGWVTLTVLLSLVIGLLWKRPTTEQESDEVADKVTPQPSHQFILILIAFGAFLVLVPEFVYIRDFFGYRINTIFKFYYQAWLLWSLAAAFGTAVLLSKLKGAWGYIHFVSLTVVLITGLTYT
ncbi:MAG: DUF2298 domain-containing protein, partial [Chloroflexota bacterium]